MQTYPPGQTATGMPVNGQQYPQQMMMQPPGMMQGGFDPMMGGAPMGGPPMGAYNPMMGGAPVMGGAPMMAQMPMG